MLEVEERGHWWPRNRNSPGGREPCLQVVLFDWFILFYPILPCITLYYHNMTKYSTMFDCMFHCILIVLIHVDSFWFTSSDGGPIWTWGSRATSATAKSFSLLRRNLPRPFANGHDGSSQHAEVAIVADAAQAQEDLGTKWWSEKWRSSNALLKCKSLATGCYWLVIDCNYLVCTPRGMSAKILAWDFQAEWSHSTMCAGWEQRKRGKFGGNWGDPRSNMELTIETIQALWTIIKWQAFDFKPNAFGSWKYGRCILDITRWY